MNTFSKEERLCSRIHLDLLFRNGSSFLLYPYRISVLVLPDAEKFPARVVINVAKKRFKHAHERNLIKRRIREVYRLSKGTILYPFLENIPHLLLSVQYVGTEIHEFSYLDQRFRKAMEKVLAKLAADVADQ